MLAVDLIIEYIDSISILKDYPSCKGKGNLQIELNACGQANSVTHTCVDKLNVILENKYTIDLRLPKVADFHVKKVKMKVVNGRIDTSTPPLCLYILN